jgi:uncharacterized protein (DUF1810 family)
MPAAPVDSQRFVDAQDRGGAYDRAVDELKAGRKATHWMWFVFPQLAGLGRSETARKHAINSLAEAQAYLEHPILGRRLAECVRLLVAHRGKTAQQIFDDVDALKLRSSMTLFSRAAPDTQPFQDILDRYYEGRPDKATVQRL